MHAPSLQPAQSALPKLVEPFNESILWGYGDAHRAALRLKRTVLVRTTLALCGRLGFLIADY